MLALAAASALHAHERLTDLATAYTQETLDQIPMQEVRSKQPPGNAITVVDIERIALDTPGTRISRVRAWPNHHPSLQCINAVGFVTVLVIPDMPTPQPTPTQGLLDAIRRHLGLHRIVCMQIAVTGPTYVVISVSTSVKVKQGANSARVIDAIRHAIDAFLDARTGGPADRGWPFGRSIYRSEILQLIDDIPGVDHVTSLSLIAGSGTPQCGDIQLCNTWLPAPGTHTIRTS
jgi:predicted phage baseplate assembly protein